MSMDEAWSFLKARQTKLHEWRAMAKPLGEMTQRHALDPPAPILQNPFDSILEGAIYDRNMRTRSGEVEVADFHDLVPPEDAPPEPAEKPESKRQHLMGLKPSQFHVTSTKTEVKRKKSSLTSLRPPESERHQSLLDRAYEYLKDTALPEEKEFGHGEEDEMLHHTLGHIFGEKTYGLHAPKEALASFLSPSQIKNWERMMPLDEGDVRDIIGPHEKHLGGKTPVGYARMAGPHVGYIYTHPDLRGMGLGTLLSQQVLGREGGLLSALRTEYGEGLANRMLRLSGRFGQKIGSAVGRKLGRLPLHAEMGPLHGMEVEHQDDDMDMHRTIRHASLPEKWGSLRPDIRTVPLSEGRSRLLDEIPDSKRPRTWNEWPSKEHRIVPGQTRIIPEEGSTKIWYSPSQSSGRAQQRGVPPYWKVGWDKEQDRLAQEAWDKMGDPGSGWNGDAPSNWRTSQQIPWHMRHLFREDEFSGNQPEHINEPSDYAYDPENGPV
jgi:GNAT superfamily N-acetyltransferase